MKKFLVIFCLLVTGLAVWATGLPEGDFDWSRARSFANGIKIKDFTLAKPRPLRLYAVRVDLTNPRVYLVTTARDKDWGQPMPDYPSMKIETRRTRVYDFMQAYRRGGQDMRLAVNASPWRPWTQPFTHQYAGSIGLAVADGVVVSTPVKRSVPAFVIRKNGRADMITFKEGDSTDDLRLAVSGFSFVLRDGKVVGKGKDLHPRTFYGLSGDRKKFYILVADGRQKGFSEGMTISEGGRFLKYLGADDGINMDGGGSTTLVTYDRGKINVENTPPGSSKSSAKDKYKYTRRVANCVGVCLRPQIVPR